MKPELRADDRYRNLPEERIVQAIIFAGLTYEAGTSAAEEIAKQALEKWIALGLGFRLAKGERLFDPVETANFMRRSSFEDRDDFFSKQGVSTHRRMVAELNRDHLEEQRFVFEYRRTFNLRSVPAGSRLRLRAPLPLAGASLKKIEVTSAQNHAGRLELRMVSSGEAEATLDATFDCTIRPLEPALSDETERALYLREQEGLIVVTERIRALAKSLAGPGASAPEALRAFWDHINRKLLFGALHYDQIDASAPCDWILEAGWTDCQTGAALFVALCRAQGIPARIVSGYLLYRVAPLRHYWAEVWLEDKGWTPHDFVGWDLANGGRDLAWRDRYFGQVDYRLILERMPREFLGPIGVPLPDAWCLHSEIFQGAVKACFMGIDGTPVYTDFVRMP